jgi:hypothetical protein
MIVITACDKALDPDSLQGMPQEWEKLVESCHLGKSSRLRFDQWQQADEVASWLDGRINTVH